MSDVGTYLRAWWHDALDGWNRFWFTPEDPATLGVIRILAGLLLLYTHAVWTLGLDDFLSAAGQLSPEFVTLHHGSPWGWSYLHGATSPWLLYTLHAGAVGVFALLTVGLATRPVAVAAFLVTVAYAHRVPATLFGLDQINALLALYLAVGPSGGAYSLDAWLWPRGAGWRWGEWAFPIEPAAPRSVLANVALRLIQVHMCVIYFFAGAGKLLGPTWWTGDALWGAVANRVYQTLDVTWLAHSPWFLQLGSQVIVLWELSYAALVWPPRTRPLVLALAVPLHLGIALCLGMVEFGLVMLVGNLAFVPSELVRWLLGERSGASDR